MWSCVHRSFEYASHQKPLSSVAPGATWGIHCHSEIMSSQMESPSTNQWSGMPSFTSSLKCGLLCFIGIYWHTDTKIQSCKNPCADFWCCAQRLSSCSHCSPPFLFLSCFSVIPRFFWYDCVHLQQSCVYAGKPQGRSRQVQSHCCWSVVNCDWIAKLHLQIRLHGYPKNIWSLCGNITTLKCSTIFQVR